MNVYIPHVYFQGRLKGAYKIRVSDLNTIIKAQKRPEQCVSLPKKGQPTESPKSILRQTKEMHRLHSHTKKS